MSAEWLAFPVGIIIATLVTMVGLSGGVLWTPYLIFVAGLDPTKAVLTSLIIQIGGSGSGSLACLLRKRADPRLGLVIGLAAVPGVGVGVWLGSVINPRSIVFLLGLACLAAALLFVSAREEYEFRPTGQVSQRALVPFLWIPPLLSTLTGLLSVGVGDFFVPVLRSRLGMKMDAAIGVCLIVIFLNATLAAVLHVFMGNRFPTTLVIFAVAGVLVGGQIGPRLATRVRDQTLKEIFIFGLSLLGIHIIFNA